MDLTQLLLFLPFIFAVFLVYHLIFKVQLPSKSLGAIFSYILGVVVIFFVIGWLISRFLGFWTNEMLQAGQNLDWQQAVNTSEGIIRDAFGTESDSSTTLQQPLNNNNSVTQPVIVVTATPPRGDTAAGQHDNGNDGGTSTLIEYVVQPGDTISSIGRQFGVTNQAIIDANKATLFDPNNIIVGQKLIIPTPSQ